MGDAVNAVAVVMDCSGEDLSMRASVIIERTVLKPLMALNPMATALISGNMVYCPRFSVLSSRVFAVFMISALFWYEREAEIMLTISSTVLTLL